MVDQATQFDSIMRQTQCLIVAKKEVAPRHFRVTFAQDEISRAVRAGHFVHILPRSNTSFDPLLRRAFSIVSAQNGTFDVLFKILGRGTALMSAWPVGETVDIIGPLGKAFEPLPANAILVGGGVGTPPMAMLASQSVGNAVGNKVAIIGARTGSEVLCLQDFADYNVPVKVATDDGTMGHRGFVTDLLKIELTRHSHGEMPLVYSCGPLPMLRAVSQICAEMGARCQVSLEENMPCGVGVCKGCVIPVLGQSDDYGSYRRICVDGPVAWSHEVDWVRWGDGATAS